MAWDRIARLLRAEIADAAPHMQRNLAILAGQGAAGDPAAREALAGIAARALGRPAGDADAVLVAVEAIRQGLPEEARRAVDSLMLDRLLRGPDWHVRTGAALQRFARFTEAAADATRLAQLAHVAAALPRGPAAGPSVNLTGGPSGNLSVGLTGTLPGGTPPGGLAADPLAEIAQAAERLEGPAREAFVQALARDGLAASSVARLARAMPWVFRTAAGLPTLIDALALSGSVEDFRAVANAALEIADAPERRAVLGDGLAEALKALPSPMVGRYMEACPEAFLDGRAVDLAARVAVDALRTEDADGLRALQAVLRADAARADAPERANATDHGDAPPQGAGPGARPLDEALGRAIAAAARSGGRPVLASLLKSAPELLARLPAGTAPTAAALSRAVTRRPALRHLAQSVGGSGAVAAAALGLVVAFVGVNLASPDVTVERFGPRLFQGMVILGLVGSAAGIATGLVWNAVAPLPRRLAQDGQRLLGAVAAVLGATALAWLALSALRTEPPPGAGMDMAAELAAMERPQALVWVLPAALLSTVFVLGNLGYAVRASASNRNPTLLVAGPTILFLTLGAVLCQAFVAWLGWPGLEAGIGLAWAAGVLIAVGVAAGAMAIESSATIPPAPGPGDAPRERLALNTLALAGLAAPLLIALPNMVFSGPAEGPKVAMGRLAEPAPGQLGVPLATDLPLGQVGVFTVEAGSQAGERVVLHVEQTGTEVETIERFEIRQASGALVQSVEGDGLPLRVMLPAGSYRACASGAEAACAQAVVPSAPETGWLGVLRRGPRAAARPETAAVGLSIRRYRPPAAPAEALRAWPEGQEEGPPAVLATGIPYPIRLVAADDKARVRLRLRAVVTRPPESPGPSAPGTQAERIDDLQAVLLRAEGRVDGRLDRSSDQTEMRFPAVEPGDYRICFSVEATACAAPGGARRRSVPAPSADAIVTAQFFIPRPPVPLAVSMENAFAPPPEWTEENRGRAPGAGPTFTQTRTVALNALTPILVPFGMGVRIEATNTGNLDDPYMTLLSEDGIEEIDTADDPERLLRRLEEGRYIVCMALFGSRSGCEADAPRVPPDPRRTIQVQVEYHVALPARR